MVTTFVPGPEDDDFSQVRRPKPKQKKSPKASVFPPLPVLIKLAKIARWVVERSGNDDFSEMRRLIFDPDLMIWLNLIEKMHIR
jgi:hypothetical protein